MKGYYWAGLFLALIIASVLWEAFGWKSDQQPTNDMHRQAIVFQSGMVKEMSLLCELPLFGGSWFQCGWFFRDRQPAVYIRTCNNHATTTRELLQGEQLHGWQYPVEVGEAMAKLGQFCQWHLASD